MRKNALIKRIIIFILLLVLVTTTGATCSSKKKNGDKQITITIWRTFDDEVVFQKAIESYERSNPNVTINYLKKDYAEYEQESLDALAAGKGPDIWSIKNDWVYKHYDKLVPMPKKLFIKNNKDTRTDLEIYKGFFPDIVVADNVIDDKIYGLPYSVDSLVLYYNKTHFKDIEKELYAAGRKEESRLFRYLPNDWESFLTLSKLLTKKDANGNIILSGAVLGTANISNAVDILSVLMLQNNTQMTSADKLTATFNLPVTRETGTPVYAGTNALNFYTSFADPTKENYMWNDSLGDSLLAFINGKTSMMINYAYQRKRISQEAPNLLYDISPLPQVNGATKSVDYASYWTETVTNNSKNPSAAWNFIKFYYTNYLGDYQSATQKPLPKRINELQVPQTKERVSSGRDPLKFQMMSAAYWYHGKYPDKITTIFQKMIADVVVNKEPLQKSIDAAAASVTELYKLSASNTTQPPTTTSTSSK